MLFHKCGNNYVNNVHMLYSGTQYFRSLQPHEYASFSKLEKTEDFVNVRCRNFGLSDIKNFNLLEDKESRFLIFTRHPASFIVSAAKYHTRGEEEWARTRALNSLGGLTLHGALNDASSDSEKYLIIMKHFKFIYEKQASLSNLFGDYRCLQVKTEELFSSIDPEYYRNIAKFLRLGDSEEYINALMMSSPAFQTKLPNHATGVFKTHNILSTFDAVARSYFEEHFVNYGEALGYL